MKLDKYAIANLTIFAIYQIFGICDAIFNPRFDAASIVTWVVASVALALMNAVTLYLCYKESK